VAYEVNGAATIDFAEDGLECRMVLPLDAILAPKTPPASAQAELSFTKR
jgi:hypothetical protein